MVKILLIIGVVFFAITTFAAIVILVENDSENPPYETEMAAVFDSEEEAEYEGIASDEMLDENANSRLNPAGLNETFTIEINHWLYNNAKLEIEMVELVSGDAAWQIVDNANMFNDEPKPGKEYILAKFRIKVLEVEKDEPFNLLFDMNVDCINEQGVEYTDLLSVAGLKPGLDGDVYGGGEVIGWKAFMVDEDDMKPVACFYRKTDYSLWFDLRAHMR